MGGSATKRTAMATFPLRLLSMRYVKSYPKVCQGVLLMVFVLTCLVFWLIRLWVSLPDIAQLEQVTSNLNMTVQPNGPYFDIVEAMYSFQVDIEDISPHVINTLLFREDKRFYSHRGIDLWGFGR